MEIAKEEEATGDQPGRVRQHARDSTSTQVETFHGNVQKAHAHAFTVERNIMGWEKEGILPGFNRCQLWKLKTKLSATEEHHALQSSHGSMGDAAAQQAATTVEDQATPVDCSTSGNMSGAQVQLRILHGA